jgi:hypothetical protein|tara:strand:- start:1351 stop:2253 length:903 start_codon:yes stop_codon:yes gene_type:complete
VAVSDSKNFELDVNEHIEEAFERCGLEARTGYDLRTAKRSLNLLFAEWANRGINRWTIEQKTIALANGVANYPLGTLTMTVNSTTSFQDGEAITGGTSAATASITNVDSSTVLAITIPNGTFSASETITGGTSGATATVSSAVSLEDTQASIDVLSAVTRQNSGTSSQSDLSITRIGRDAYLSLASKRSTGRPVQFYVDRLITPEIKLWPTPDSSSSYELVFDRLRRIDDADTQENTVEVPFRFYPCVSAGLAYYLSVKFAPDKVQLLKAIYEEELQRAMQEDRDRSSLLIAPSLDYYRV